MNGAVKKVSFFLNASLQLKLSNDEIQISQNSQLFDLTPLASHGLSYHRIKHQTGKFEVINMRKTNIC